MQAVASITHIIKLKAEDSASAAIDKARNSLDKMGNQAVKTGKALKEIDPGVETHKRVQELSGDLEGAVKGFGDFAGGAGQAISGLADRLGAAEAILRVLPGPAGIAATAIAGLALGGKLLYDHLSQSEAKLKLLGGDQARKLKDDLDLSADAAIKLAHAIQDLPSGILPPTKIAINQVRDAAVSMGRDGAEAVAAYAKAMAGSREEQKQFAREYGIVISATKTRIAEFVGVERELLEGEQKRLNLQEEIDRRHAEEGVVLKQHETSVRAVADGMEAQARAGRELAALIATRKTLEASAQDEGLAGIDTMIAAQRKLMAEREATIKLAGRDADAQAANADRLKGVLGVLAERRRIELETKEIRTTADVQSASAAVVAAQATIEKSKGLSYVKQTEAIELRQSSINLRLVALAKERETIGEALFQKAFKLLQIEDAQLVAQRNAIAASKRADAQAAAQRAKARSDEANKRAQAEIDYTDHQKSAALKAFDDEFALSQEAAKNRTASADSAATAVAEARRKEATSLSEVLKARGDFGRAAQVEAAQDEADRAAEIARINKSIEARRNETETLSLRTTSQAGFQGNPIALAQEAEALKGELASLEIERLAKVDAVRATYADKERKRQDEAKAQAEKAAAELRGMIAQASQSLQGPAQMIGGMLGSALGQAASGIANVAGKWEGLAKSAPDAIGAAGAVAAAFVDGEREKAGILAIMEAAQAVASFALNPVAAAGHAAAAALYAGVAVGAISTGGGSGTGASAGGFSNPTSTSPSATGQQTQGATQIININTPLTSRQDVAKGLQQGLRSLSTTGYAKSKGV